MPYQRSKYTQIMAAVLHYAQQAHDDPAELATSGQNPYVSATRTATKLWEVPSINEYQQAGEAPFLAVRFGRKAGYGLGGLLQSADLAAQGPGATEPYWDFEIFSLHPYDETSPNYDDAATDMTLLEQVFNAPENHTLGGVCQSCYVADSTPAYVELVDGTALSAAYLVIRTGEFLIPE